MQHQTWIGLGVILLAADLALGQPSLSHTTPAAVQPGETIELTLHGAELDGPVQIWTSFPAEVELLPAKATGQPVTKRRCRLKVDRDVPIGIGGMMVGTAKGLTGIKLIMVDDLPTLLDSGSNHSQETAQNVEIPQAIDAVLDGAESDYYQFSVEAGQRISCEVLSARLASDADPVVRLLDSDGDELLLVDDDASHGPDPRFQYQFERAGNYFLEVRDNRFRTGGRCRLRIGDFPLVSVPYPLGGRLGSTCQFQFAGTAAIGVQPVLLQLPNASDRRKLTIGAKYLGARSSSIATLVVSSLPERLEVEPNDSAVDATTVILPCALNGRLQRKRDRDYYSFPAKKGQAYAFRAVSRELGSPSVPLMRIHDVEGKQIAETEVTNVGDLTLRHRFQADGVYCLSVEDLLRRSGPEHAYRVEVEPDIGFELSLKTEKGSTSLSLPANGGAVKMPVQVGRHGYDGPIQLSFSAHFADCRSEDCSQDEACAQRNLLLVEGLIPATAEDHVVIIAVRDGTDPGTLMTVRLSGHATINGREQTRALHTGRVVREAWPFLTTLPGWIDGLLAVASGAAADSPFDIKLTSESIAFDPETGSAQWMVSLERKHEDFKGPLTIAMHGLPEAYSYTVENKEDEYIVTVKGPREDAPTARGELLAFGELAGKGWVVTRKVELIAPRLAGPPRDTGAEARTD